MECCIVSRMVVHFLSTLCPKIVDGMANSIIGTDKIDAIIEAGA
ncbi:hypothetical protein N9W70_02490 [Schleiferiaceae bacterium]|nr:hypothetical protein [Schleiferiaceae bacterium]